MNVDAKAFTPDAGTFGGERTSLLTQDRSRGQLRVAASEFVFPVAEQTQGVPLSPTAEAFDPSVSVPLCRFFAQGVCHKGLDCPFLHDGVPSSPTAEEFAPSVSVPLCRFFAQGVCHKGLDCPFLHDSDSALKSGCLLAKADGSEEQLSRTTLEYEVDDGINCCFGPGADVVRLDLGSGLQAATSSSVIITGLKIWISEHDVESRLSPFGALLSLQVKRSKGSDVVFAKATFSEPNAAVLASGALNGTPLNTWIGLSCAAGKSRSEVKGSMDPISVTALSKLRTLGSSAISIKLQWYAPSRFCWVYFDHRLQAEKATKTLNGINFDGRQLESRFQQPSFRQKTKFAVWLGNLPPEASAEKLTGFLRRSAKVNVSVELGKVPFREHDGPLIIQELLRKFGPLSSFKAADDKTTLKRRALARFVREIDAKAACEYFQRTKKIEVLGNTQVFAQSIHSTKVHLLREVFTGLRREVEHVLQSQNCIRYKCFESSRSVSISITADKKEDIDQVRKSLDPLLCGMIVRDRKNDNRPLWDRRFLSAEFQDFVKTLACDGQSAVAANSRLRQVLVFGPESELPRLREGVLKYWESCQIQTHSVPIKQSEFRFILSHGRDALDKLIFSTGAKSISLDIKNCALLVEGTTEEASRALNHARQQRAREQNIAAETELHCPICFCPPDDTSSTVRLRCQHSYCRDCFDSWLDSNRVVDFPVLCLQDGCGTPVALSDMKKFLQSDSLLRTFRSALDSYVRRSPSLNFCLDPACQGVYEVDANDQVSFCSTCSVEICTKCAVSHPSQSCQEYQQSEMPVNHVRLKIVDEILTLRCPRCRQAFLDFDGCFALRCSICPCAFCGWCLKDCGTDAHSHVRTCDSRPPGHAENYFGTEAQFIEAQKKNRERQVRAFLSTLNREDVANALQSCKVDLDDLGIAIQI